MWVLRGRFSEDSRTEQEKHLKYGETYVVGRKIPADIIVDSKFVSRTACHITVAALPDSERSQIDARPPVTIRFEPNKSRKAFSIRPPSSPADKNPPEFSIPAQQEVQLETGASFSLTNTIALTLVWQPMAICFAGKIKEAAISPFREHAHKIGVHLSPPKSKWKDGYTHLCLTQVKPTESVLGALIQARPIVTPDYVREVLRVSQLPRHDPASFENEFRQVPPASFLPALDPIDFLGIDNIHEKMAPNHVRTEMFRGTTCVFMLLSDDDQNEFTIYQNILTMAGARISAHDPIKEGLYTKAQFTKLLMPYKNRAISYRNNSGPVGMREAPDDGLVVLCSAAHDDADWKHACEQACANLRIAMPSGLHVVTNAICNADVRSSMNVIPTLTADRSLDDSGPQPIPEVEMQAADEQAVPVPVESDADADATRIEDGALTECTTYPTVAPQAEVPQTAGPTSTDPESQGENTSDAAARALAGIKRPLRRRTNRTNLLDEMYGSSNTFAHDPKVPAPANEGPDAIVVESIATDPSSGEVVPSTPFRQSGHKPALRSGTGRTRSRRSEIFDDLLGGSLERAVEISTQGQANSRIPRSKKYRMELDEEDRHSQDSSVLHRGESAQEAMTGSLLESIPEISPAQAKTKRPADDEIRRGPSKRHRSVDIENEHHESAESTTAEVQEVPSNRVISRSRHESNSGVAQGGMPDTEPEFLQALNTQKSRRKKMDEFDDEFNQLKITKPARAITMARRSDADGRGDVDEDFEAFKRLAEEELRFGVRGNFVQVDFVPLIAKRADKARPVVDEGVPNFKKFKPKGQRTQASQRRAPLALDLGARTDYGIGEAYWSERGAWKEAKATDPREEESETVAEASVTRTRRRIVLDISDGDSNDENIPSKRRGAASRRSQTMGAGASQQSTRVTRTAGAANLALDGISSGDDDADDSILPARSRSSRSRSKALEARQRGSKRNAEVAQLDFSDGDETISDDDGNFAGFGASTSARNRRAASTARGASSARWRI